MEKKKIAHTAQVNLRLMADIGVPEAIQFQKAFCFDDRLLRLIPKKALLCIAAIAESLYESTNLRIEAVNNPVIFDLACGYGPRATRMVPQGYRYIGGDLPSVVEDIRAQLDKQKGYDDLKALYKCIDVTDRAAVEEAINNVSDKITIVTQGLLTYLNAERKHLLAYNMHKILEDHGGCWMIPDASPDQMLNCTFEAIIGNHLLVSGIYKLRDTILHRDASTINWKNTEEIVKGLEAEGFHVDVVPLWQDGMNLHVFDHVNETQKKALIENWKKMNFVIATV